MRTPYALEFAERVFLQLKEFYFLYLPESQAASFATVAPRLTPEVLPDGEFVAEKPAAKRLDLAHVVPWFIIGFLALVACHSLGLVPNAFVAPIGRIATLLTVMFMTALELGVVN